MVAQVDEDQPPVVAFPVDPAGEADGLTRVGGAQGAAGMAAIGVHVRVAKARKIKARKSASRAAKVKVSGRPARLTTPFAA
jgi:hypothetical protein